jgi:geranylgeranyl pyrophosphate synthase
MERTNKTTITNILNFIKPDILEMESLIRDQVKDNHPDLGLALDLLISAGGKRIRPTITLLASRCLDADHEKSITMAASIELLHTATLVHDDLIDGSFLRRGLPTLNAKWSAGATVLTGDFLFASAAKLASETNSIDVMKLFSKTLRTIVNGEVSQMFNDRCKPGMDLYLEKIYAKTASLFETSASAAGIISNSPPEIIRALAEYGHEIGMAFQITDDILDFNGDTTVLGKPIGSDLKLGLITLPTQIFIDEYPNHPLVKKLFLNGCLTNESDITEFLESIINSSAIEKSYSVAESFIQKGINALKILPDTAEREMLAIIASTQVYRNK